MRGIGSVGGPGPPVWHGLVDGSAPAWGRSLVNGPGMVGGSGKATDSHIAKDGWPARAVALAGNRPGFWNLGWPGNTTGKLGPGPAAGSMGDGAITARCSIG